MRDALGDGAVLNSGYRLGVAQERSQAARVRARRHFRACLGRSHAVEVEEPHGGVAMRFARPPSAPLVGLVGFLACCRPTDSAVSVQLLHAAAAVPDGRGLAGQACFPVSLFSLFSRRPLPQTNRPVLYIRRALP